MCYVLTMQNDCLEWTGGITNIGYGRYTERIKDPVRFKTVLAHRRAWEVMNGPIPDGFDVLHTCDNRRCFNVDHLRLGSHTDNMRDMVSKKRANKKWSAKTGTRVWLKQEPRNHEIRTAFLFGAEVKTIADLFGLSVGYVYKVIKCI